MIDAVALDVADAQIKALQNIIIVQDQQMRSLDGIFDPET
jgi:hypothetical protein